MEPYHKYHFLLSSLFTFLLIQQQQQQPVSCNVAGHHHKSNVSAVLLFGDSTVDPGNNNYVATIFRADFPPYGQDFAYHVPTGRFTNGRLSTDFIASYLGVKDYIPPYLEPTLGIPDLMTGVSFASAGSGFDPLTPKISSTVSMAQQLEYLKEYKQTLESAIGKRRTEEHMKKALFIISAGTNDFVVNYFTLPFRRKTYSVSAYQRFVWLQAKHFIQSLVEEGARRIIYTSLPPMGCLPIVITLFSRQGLGGGIFDRSCIPYFSSVGRDFNRMVKNELSQLQHGFDRVGATVYFDDVYGPLNDMIQGPASSGFEKVTCGCCGTGVLEASILCNSKSLVCPDASKYVFWDSIHPTEMAYYNLFKSVKPTLDSIMKA